MMRAIGIIAALVCAPHVAGANPVDAFGFGARGASMAGAQTAATRDGGAHYYNPSVLATFDDIRFYVGYQTAVPKLRVNGLDLGVDSSRGFAAAVTIPGMIGPVKVAVGGGLFLPDQQVTRIRALPAGQPRFALFDNRPQRIFLGANVAFKVGERLSVGGGIAYMSNTAGGVVLSGRLGFPIVEDSDLAISIDQDLRTVRYPQAGLHWVVNDWLDVGAVYRGGFELTISQGVLVAADIGPPDMEPLVEDASVDILATTLDLFQPEQIGAGLNAQFGSFTVAFDLTFHRWSEFKNPAADIQIEIDAGMFNDQIDIPEALPLTEPHFADIVIPRLGVEWLAFSNLDTDVHLRGGYSFEPSPAPEQVGESNFVDNDKHTLAAGAGWTVSRWSTVIPKPVTFDVFVATTVLAPRNHNKLSPVNSVGDYRSSGQVWQAGLSSRWSF